MDREKLNEYGVEVIDFDDMTSLTDLMDYIKDKNNSEQDVVLLTRNDDMIWYMISSFTLGDEYNQRECCDTYEWDVYDVVFKHEDKSISVKKHTCDEYDNDIILIMHWEDFDDNTDVVTHNDNVVVFGFTD